MLPVLENSKDWAFYVSVIAVFTVFGVTAARFLKRLGNGARVAVNATMVIVTSPLQVWILSYSFSTQECIGISVILSGMALYGKALVDANNAEAVKNAGAAVKK